jgi:large repetitive protein
MILSGQMLLNQGAVAAINAPLSNFFGGDSSNRGGIRVGVANLGDGVADVITGSGQGGGSQVSAYLGSTLTTGSITSDFDFNAFPGYSGGVFVG